MKFKFLNAFLVYFILFFIVSKANSFSISGKIRNNVVEEDEENEFAFAKSGESKTSAILKKCDPCPSGIQCVPQIQCPAHVRMKPHEKPQVCDLPAGGKYGFCCVTGQNHTMSSNKGRSFHLQHLQKSIIEEARAKFSHMLQHFTWNAVPRGQPEFLHNIVFHSSHRDIVKNVEISNSAMEQIVTSQILKEKEHIPIEEFETNSIDVEFSTSPLGQHCPVSVPCPDINTKYRSIDGSCNNPLPHRALWGAARQPMERLLPPAYEDGIWIPRMHSADGSPLTGAREISRILLPDVSRLHPKYNLLLMQFGQFIAHDVTQSASITLANGEAVQCCSPDGSQILPPQSSHYACLAIPIDPEDEFYRMFNQGCLNFVRLSLAPSLDCKMGYGRQLSKVTHYLDASPVYGSDLTAANELRTFRGGRLRMFDDFGRDLLPLSNDRDACASIAAGNTCFQSGDGRTNQIISVIVIHILFAREHNRIADILAELNPHYPDEILYQEARRIVIAELQHIVYNEWLPLVIGSVQMKRFGLETRHHTYSSSYSPEVNAAITNEFSGAAFRFGHSTVDGRFHLHKDNFVDEVIDIPDVMFNPTRMRKRDFLNDLTRTLTEQPMQKVDDSITHGLSRYLFRGANPFGLDLAALNIQRGRDQGLRSYNDYLEVIGHRRIHSFNEFPLEIASRLARVYKHPDDIDLWLGGLLEHASGDALVGITFADIIADQFSRFRHGDRYFYENDPSINPGHFTADQLEEIRKVSMARIICDNIDQFSGNEIPPLAFIRADFHGNNPIRCDSHAIPAIDFSAWQKG